MFLSKYSYVFDYDESCNVIFQSHSKKVIVVPKRFFIKRSLELHNFSAETRDFMLKNYFVFTSEEDEKAYAVKKIKEQRQLLENELSVVIETTNHCNISCSFCYQKGWAKSSREISPDTLLQLNAIISAFVRVKQIEVINLSIIGGEPLLNKSFITFYGELKKLCSLQGIKIKTKINTNGILLTPSFVNMFDDINIIVPLNSKKEYGKLIRPNDNKTDIYNKVISNIKLCADLFNFHRQLIIRYNTNQDNIYDFEDFVKELSALEIPNMIIIPEYLFNVGSGTFTNKLNRSDFVEWSQTKALYILRKFGFPLPYKLQQGMNICKGMGEFTFKVYADGRFSLCNGDSYEISLPSLNSIDSIFEISALLHDKKVFDSKCLCCRKIFVCPNIAPCRRGEDCDADSYEFENYIRTLVKFKRSTNGSV